jgi:hypothetical protein
MATGILSSGQLSFCQNQHHRSGRY